MKSQRGVSVVEWTVTNANFAQIRLEINYNPTSKDSRNSAINVYSRTTSGGIALTLTGSFRKFPLKVSKTKEKVRLVNEVML
jgi:hypothetical protein